MVHFPYFWGNKFFHAKIYKNLMIQFRENVWTDERVKEETVFYMILGYRRVSNKIAKKISNLIKIFGWEMKNY